jgi:ribosomal protein S18 acetylase RimI-like enzyme
MTPCEIRRFRIADLDSARQLWAASEGLGIGPGDSTDAIGRFLERNQGLSLVAVDGATMAAAILCGHDGRRGYIYRLSVARAYRRQGIAADLVRRCLAGLKTAGIERCLALVQDDNAGGRAFWESVGGRFRKDLVAFSIDL